jgi:hypothetical protein
MNWRCALGFHELRAWNWPTYSNEPVPYGPRNAPTWYSWRECARCGTYWLRDQYDGLAPPEWKRATAVEYFHHIDSLREERNENADERDAEKEPRESRLRERGLLRDEDWRPLDGEICRVIEFRPMAGRVEGTEVKSSSRSLPYAAIEIESPILDEPTTGFITHKLDFRHLWEVFNVRGVSGDEEVLVIWNKSNLRRGMRWSARSMPGLVVWVCRKPAYELISDPTFRPELDGFARHDASNPIVEYKPEVFDF